jgi:hypothetical protein
MAKLLVEKFASSRARILTVPALFIVTLPVLLGVFVPVPDRVKL